jgi:hypothetical protein
MEPLNIFSRDRRPKESNNYPRRVWSRIITKFWRKPLGFLGALLGIVLIETGKLDL